MLLIINPLSDSVPGFIHAVLGEALWALFKEAKFDGAYFHYELLCHYHEANGAVKQLLRSIPGTLDSWANFQKGHSDTLRALLADDKHPTRTLAVARDWAAFAPTILDKCEAMVRDSKSLTKQQWREMTVSILVALYYYATSGEEIYLVMFNPGDLLGQVIGRFINPHVICYSCGDLKHMADSCPKNREPRKRKEPYEGSGYGSAHGAMGNGRGRSPTKPTKMAAHSPPRRRSSPTRQKSPGRSSYYHNPSRGTDGGTSRRR